MKKSYRQKVLFISYFFPPLGGGGVIRVVKFVKFLPEFGWQPIVLTCQKGFYPLEDKSLLQDLPRNTQIERVDYFEPGRWFKAKIWRFFWTQILSPLFLIPDNQRLWFWSGLRKAREIIQKEKIEVIFTSSASYTDHLIALALKRITGVKWAADFRDEWTKSPYYKFPISLHRAAAEYLEKKILKEADLITTVSEGLTKSYQEILGANLPAGEAGLKKFQTITNGFDKEDFEKNQNAFRYANAKFKIVHIGSLYGLRKTDTFLRVIDELKLKDVEVEFVGRQSRMSHQEAISKMLQADVLLLILSPQDGPAIMTGKIYEYLAARKPILAVAPKNSGACQLIAQLKVGEIADPRDAKEIRSKILKMYRSWQKNQLKVPKIDLSAFERRNLTQKLCSLFDKLSVNAKKKIKLCLIGNLQSSQNQRLCEYFKNKNYEIHFITTKPQKMVGIKTYNLESGPTIIYFFKSFFKIRRLIGKIQPDIVHGQDLIFAGIWAYLSGFRPYVVTIWGTDVFGYNSFIPPEKVLVRRTLQKANSVTGTSLALKNKAVRIGLNPAQFELIHFGIDLEIFKKKSATPLGQNSALKKEKIIFCPRAIAPIYNLDILVRAFAKICQKRKNVKLALLKNAVDENYLIEVEKLIIKYDLIDRVIFWPPVANAKMVDYYNLAEVVVSIPSSDGCSVSFLEAMACEKKIVVSDLEYIKEWTAGKNFWKVPPRNAEETAKGILAALKYPKEKWQAIGRANRQLVREKAEIKSNFEKLDKLYRELL